MLIIQKFLNLLTPSEKKKAIFLLSIIFAMALLDMIGIASIMPFMGVLANPKIVETNLFLATVYEKLGFTTYQDYLFALGVLVFVLLIFSLAFKALTIYAQIRFALMWEYSIARRLVEGYLHQPYSWFLSRNSSDLGKTILSEVGVVVSGGMLPLFTLLAQSAVTLAILLLLLIIEPFLAIAVGTFLGLAYVFIFKLISGKIRLMGKSRV